MRQFVHVLFVNLLQQKHHGEKNKIKNLVTLVYKQSSYE